jgi:hypothetical protein
MKRLAILLLLSLICLFAGCAKYYYQEGKSFAQCERDRLDCFNELKKRANWEMPGAYEYEYMEKCMKQKGYRLVKESELPDDVKRQDPADTVVGRAYEGRRGIAGTLD